MSWTTTDLISSVKRRTGMPVAQASYTNAEILEIANEEMGSFIVPLVLRQREDYWLAHKEEPLVDGVYTYQFPRRCVGGKLREVLLLTADRSARNVPRVSPSDFQYVDSGFYMGPDSITLLPDSSAGFRSAETLRISYYLRPSRLVESSAVAVISDLDATTVTLASVPSAFAGQDTWDLVSAESPFAVQGSDLPGTLSGSVVTLSGGVPSGVQVGDYVCLPDESPVPQLPIELHALLAQKVACRVLEAKQLFEKLKAAQAELGRLASDAATLLTPRVDGEPVRLVVRNGLHRMRW